MRIRFTRNIVRTYDLLPSVSSVLRFTGDDWWDSHYVLVLLNHVSWFANWKSIALCCLCLTELRHVYAFGALLFHRFISKLKLYDWSSCCGNTGKLCVNAVLILSEEPDRLLSFCAVLSTVVQVEGSRCYCEFERTAPGFLFVSAVQYKFCCLGCWPDSLHLYNRYLF